MTSDSTVHKKKKTTRQNELCDRKPNVAPLVLKLMDILNTEGIINTNWTEHGCKTES